MCDGLPLKFMVSLQIWAICQHQVPSAAAENQAVKATRDDPSKKGQSPLKRTDLAPTRNLGLIADTSHTRPQCPISYRDLVPRPLTAETHLSPSTPPQLQSKPSHWLLPRQTLFILLQCLTSSHMYKYSYIK